MNILAVMIGMAAGLIIGDFACDLRIRQARHEVEQLSREKESGLEHEAYLREKCRILEEANAYFRSKNAERYIP